MTDPASTASGRAAELRRAFDGAFAVAPSDRVVDAEDFVALRLGSDPFAIRLCEINGLFADKPINPLPSPLPELLGIAGFRGEIVPVYDLRALLGCPASGPLRWLVLVSARGTLVVRDDPRGTPSPLALAFDAFEGHLRVPRSAITAEADAQLEHVRDVVRGDGVTRPIVHVDSLINALAKRAEHIQQRTILDRGR